MSEPIEVLLPCPFCGNRHPMLVLHEEHGGKATVMCVACELGMSGASAQAVEQRWNTRTDKAVQELEKQIVGLKVMINMGLTWADVLKPIDHSDETKH